MLLSLLIWNLFVYGSYSEMRTRLTHDWTSGAVKSDLAKHIAEHQSRCTSKVYYHEFAGSGMGSDVHVWTQALCNAMQEGATLVQFDGAEWIWNDAEMCSVQNHSQPLSCYFNMQSNCPISLVNEPTVITWLNKYENCPQYIQDLPSRQLFRAAAIEYLFSSLNPQLVAEAEASIPHIFGEKGIPERMITVHMRWGDKRKEMDLVHQRDYVQAIQALVDKHGITEPHVFITTESHIALEKLTKEVVKKRKNWTLHHYAPAVYHSNKEMAMAAIASQTSGKLGRASLVSLLLAMEAQYYVVTSGSNWSRLIDELRKNVVDASCGGCTDLVDLREAIEKMQDW